VLFLAFVVFLNQVLAENQVSNESSSATDVAGCYQLKLGHWWPWGLDGDRELVTPPSKIELLTKRGTEGWEEGQLLIRALPNSPGRNGPSFWQAQADGGIKLTWTDGFTGLTVDLKRNRDGFSGSAHPHFDTFRLVKHVAHVEMHRIACDVR
jgi:hypothetical protein